MSQQVYDKLEHHFEKNPNISFKAMYLQAAHGPSI